MSHANQLCKPLLDPRARLVNGESHECNAQPELGRNTLKLLALIFRLGKLSRPQLAWHSSPGRLCSRGAQSYSAVAALQRSSAELDTPREGDRLCNGTGCVVVCTDWIGLYTLLLAPGGQYLDSSAANDVYCQNDAVLALFPSLSTPW